MNHSEISTAAFSFSASAALCALCLGLGAASSAAADTAVDAALQACIGPDTPFAQRIDALASAGWTVEVDSPLARDRTFLFQSLRLGDLFLNGGDASVEKLVAARDRAILVGPNPGQPPEAAYLLDQLASASWAGVALEQGASAILLQARLDASAENAVSLECTLILADPVAVETPVAPLTAAQFDLYQDQTQGSAPSVVERTIRLTRDDGAIAQIRHLDLAAVPAVADILSKAGSDARLATLMFTTLHTVPEGSAP